MTAERLMRLDPQRRPFTVSLRPLLDLVWRAAAGDQTVDKPIAVFLGEFYLSDYCHNDGPDGPDDADDDPAAATLYAAMCYLHGLRHFASLVADRAIDAAEYRVQLANEDPAARTEVDVELEAAKAMATEVRQQVRNLDELAARSAQLSSACGGLPITESGQLLADLRRIT